MKPETGRFSEDTYARARAFLDKQQSRPEADTPKPAPKRASAPAPAPKRDMSTVGPRRSMTTMKGSGRGGQGGPTADELDAYKAKRDKVFSDSVNKYVGEQSAAQNRREMLSLAGDVAGATGAGIGLRALGMASRGAKAAASTEAGKKALSTLKDMTSGGPRVAKTTMPARPTAKAGAKRDVPDAVRRSEEGFSPAEANKALAKATKSAPAKKKAAPASKPTITAAAKPKAPRKTATTTTRKFNDEEKGVEFKRGGKVKRKGY